MKKTHEHHNMTPANRNTKHTVNLSENSFSKKKKKIRNLKWVSHFSTLNPKAKIFTGIPYKNGFFTPSLMNHLCLNAFSRRPLLSTLLCSLHQVSLSLSNFISRFFVVNLLGHCDFLVSVAAEVLGVVLFQISMPLCYILIFLNWVPRFCKVSCFFVSGYFALTPMHACMNMLLKRFK